MSLPRRTKVGRGVNVQSPAKSLKRTAAEAFLPIDVDESEADSSSSNGSHHHAAVPKATNDNDNDDATSSSYITSSSESEDSATEEQSEEEDVAQEHEAAATGHGTDLSPTSDLRSKLSAFLPKMAQANENLANGTNERLDDVADHEEHYIEMDLGLGVLSDTSHRKRNGDIRLEQNSDSDEATSASSDDMDGEVEQDSNVMETLKGNKTKCKRRKIEELG